MSVDELNKLPEAEAYALLESCCCAPNWVATMLQARPFVSKQQVLQLADSVWSTMEKGDYFAAFEGHPQIGDLSTLREKYRQTAGSAGHEQSGMQQANEQILQSMMQLNKDYLAKFGFIFIVCASGKSAAEMLQIIEQRINNSVDQELKIAAAEQGKITKIRLDKLL